MSARDQICLASLPCLAALCGDRHVSHTVCGTAAPNGSQGGVRSKHWGGGIHLYIQILCKHSLCQPPWRRRFGGARTSSPEQHASSGRSALQPSRTSSKVGGRLCLDSPSPPSAQHATSPCRRSSCPQERPRCAMLTADPDCCCWLRCARGAHAASLTTWVVEAVVAARWCGTEAMAPLQLERQRRPYGRCSRQGCGPAPATAGRPWVPRVERCVALWCSRASSGLAICITRGGRQGQLPHRPKPAHRH